LPEDFYTKIFISILKNKLKSNQHFVLLIVGRPGSGKSYTALRIAELIDENFTLNNVAYTPAEFIKLVRELSEGSVVIFDEAGVGVYSRDWQNKINRAFAKLVQILRYKRLGIIFTTPHAMFLDKAVRVLFDYILLVEGFDRKNEVTICNAFWNPPVNFVLGNEVLRPFAIVKNGKRVEVEELFFAKPSLAEEYEELARIRKDRIIAELEKEMETLEDVKKCPVCNALNDVKRTTCEICGFRFSAVLDEAEDHETVRHILVKGGEGKSWKKYVELLKWLARNFSNEVYLSEIDNYIIVNIGGDERTKKKYRSFLFNNGFLKVKRTLQNNALCEIDTDKVIEFLKLHIPEEELKTYTIYPVYMRIRRGEVYEKGIE